MSKFQYVRASRPDYKILFVEFVEKHASRVFDTLHDQGFRVEPISEKDFTERKITLKNHVVPGCFVLTMDDKSQLNLVDLAIEACKYTKHQRSNNRLL
jgi:hypothetical protein